MPVSLGAIFLGTGCAVGPNYRPPVPDLPEQWHQKLAEGTADVREWWKVFGDEKLTELIERAAEGNLELRMAVLRIREARALRGVAAGELLPVLGAEGGYLRSRASAHGPAAVPQAPGNA